MGLPVFMDQDFCVQNYMAASTVNPGLRTPGYKLRAAPNSDQFMIQIGSSSTGKLWVNLKPFPFIAIKPFHKLMFSFFSE